MLSRKMFTAMTVTSVFFLSLSISNGFAEEKTGLSSLTDAAKSVSAAVESGSLGDLIDINKANTETIAAIPGIGPKLAEAITTYREANGAFAQAKDLANIEGIDMSLVEKIKPFLKF